VDAGNETFFKAFYQALASRPLHPHDPFYVPLLTRSDLATSDPVDSLRRCIEWRGTASVQLFSGFRGTGKSTELRRLCDCLVRQGLLVVLCDMEDYLNLSMPVDVSDFLIAVAGAFGEALDQDHLLGEDKTRPSYWDRITAFMKSEVQFLEGVEAEGVKLGLKADPDFKTRIQDRMKGHLGSLVKDVQAYMVDCVKRLRARHGADKSIVLLLDSVEHLRGTSINADDVHDSLENLFAGHCEKLRFQSMHVVYTVPPWLKIRTPGVEGNYDGGEVIPCVKVLDRGTDGPFRAGVDALVEIVQKRGDWSRLLGKKERLIRLILASGGYLRDLFRLLQATLRLAAQRGQLPVSDELVELAIADLRNDYLPIARRDAIWLDKVAGSHRTELENGEALKVLARFFDTHLVLCYRNGEEWFDVHPVIRDHVRQLANPGTARAEAGTDEC